MTLLKKFPIDNFKDSLIASDFDKYKGGVKSIIKALQRDAKI